MKAWAECALGYRFVDYGLLEQALTHRSKGGRNYERLEFLGDSILNFVIAESLYDRFPRADEGNLSRARARLVRKETLAEIARERGFGDHLVLGGGELKSGGFNRDSILADSVEAVIGAIYKDGGMDAAQAFIQRAYARLLDAVHPDKLPKDPKTRLQELLQERGEMTPTYRLLEVTGQPHAQHFLVECVVDGLERPVRGEGASRRKAEQAAAAEAYGLLTGSDA